MTGWSTGRLCSLQTPTTPTPPPRICFSPVLLQTNTRATSLAHKLITLKALAHSHSWRLLTCQYKTGEFERGEQQQADACNETQTGTSAASRLCNWAFSLSLVLSAQVNVHHCYIQPKRASVRLIIRLFFFFFPSCR